jgi:hypothetical protein
MAYSPLAAPLAADLPLPPFESTTELLMFFIALTVLSHGAVIVYVMYLSPTLATDDAVTVGSEWKFDPVDAGVAEDD